jgi:hypothetical protein
VVTIGVHQATRLGEQKPRLRIGRAALGDIGLIEYAEHLEQRDAAGGRLRHAHGVLPVGTADGLRPVGAIGRHVFQRHGARQRRLVRHLHDFFGNTAFVERARTFVRDAPERFGVRGVLEEIPRVQRLAVRLRKQRADLGRGRKWRAFAEVRRQTLRNLEALSGGTDGRLKQLLPGPHTQPRMRRGEHGDRSRHAGGASTANRFDERHRLPALVQEHLRCSAGRGGLATVDRGNDTRTRFVIHQERAAAHARALRLDEAEHRLYGHRGVDRLTALLENLQAGIHRERIRRDDDGRTLGSLRLRMPVQSGDVRQAGLCGQRSK